MQIIEVPVLREGKTVCIGDIIFVGTREPDQAKVKPTIDVQEFIQKLKKEIEKVGVNHEEA